MSVDLEKEEGVRVLRCQVNRLRVRIPRKHLKRVQKWRFVVASHGLHGCSHLSAPGSHMYHRILKVDHARPTKGGVVLTLDTEDLPSPSAVFSYCDFHFRYMPWEAKSPYAAERATDRTLAPAIVSREEETAEEARRLGVNLAYTHARPTIYSKFQPTHGDYKSLKFNIPKQISNLGWNWDYNANTTRNAEFEYRFPGGEGWIKLYKPYLKAHFGITVNFTSRFRELHKSPHVKLQAKLEGYAKVNADIATRIDFDRDTSNHIKGFSYFQVPILTNFTEETLYMKPLHFYMGGVPVTVDPGFSCRMKVFHNGMLQGSLRVGLKTTLLVNGLASFDTNTGLQTNISAQAIDVKFTPPTWMLFTKHFVIGAMLEPEVWVKGAFGRLRDLRVGMGLRPYVNLSIMQEGHENPFEGPEDIATSSLAIYPFRVAGLPSGGVYKIQAGVNGRTRSTSYQVSSGVIEFQDDVKDFYFGPITEQELMSRPIDVKIFESGVDEPVASGQVTCGQLVNGECHPSPVTLRTQVDNQAVIVQLAVVWKEHPTDYLMTQAQALSFAPPVITISEELTQKLQEEGNPYPTFRLKHNGRTYSLDMPFQSNGQDQIVLSSNTMFELGPCFLENWLEGGDNMLSADANELTKSTVELLVDGRVVGSGELPPMSWDKRGVTSQISTGILQDLAAFEGGGGLGSLTPKKEDTKIPVHVRFSDMGKMVASAEMDFLISDLADAAYWIYPAEAETLSVGQTYLFRFTIGSSPGSNRAFELNAFSVDHAGVLTPTEWAAQISEDCSYIPSVKVKRSHDTDPCIFTYQAQIPASVAAQTIVLQLTWADTKGATHYMLSRSVKVTYGQTRRLREGASRRGLEEAQGEDAMDDLRAVAEQGLKEMAKENPSLEKQLEAQGENLPGEENTNTFGSPANNGVSVDEIGSNTFNKHMADLAPDCSAKPLKYGIGVGVAEKNDLDAGLGVPMAGLEGEFGSLAAGLPGGSLASRFGGGLTPLYSRQTSQKLSEILPKALCAGGVCQGELPGCKPKQVNPISIKRIVFRLSRLFKWRNNVDPAIRYVISYGLAMLPEAVEIGEQEVAKLEHSTTTQQAWDDFYPTPQPTPAGPAPSEDLYQTPYPTPQQLQTPYPTPQQLQTPFPTPLPTPYEDVQQPAQDVQPHADQYQDNSESPTASQEAAVPADIPTARRLHTNTAEEEEEDGPEFNQFTVKITQPMNYKLDDEIVRKLLHMGAFRGVSDGREATHGPVFIEDFELRDPEGPAAPEQPALALGAAEEERAQPAQLVTLPHLAIAACCLLVAGLAYQVSRCAAQPAAQEEEAPLNGDAIE